MHTWSADPEAPWQKARQRLRHFSIAGELSDLADTVLRLRVLEAFDLSARHFPVYREVRFAVRRIREQVFDDLALRSGLLAQRLDKSSLILDAEQVFVSASARQKTGYTSGTLKIWARDLVSLERVRQSLLALVGEQAVREQLFTIDWYFQAPGGLNSTSFEELTDADLLDEAYPTLPEGVNAFVQRFVEARETVLILRGPPGTGKTRLVRAILAALSRRKNDSARVLYTSDKRTLENDEIFIEFLTGEHDAFVVEDADHLLGARAGGNVDLHRFLTVADGVVRAQGRKIVFTTNLPNVRDIDEALVRPGRCFALVHTRALSRSEAEKLITRLPNLDEPHRMAALALMFPAGAENVTLAELFRAVERSGASGASYAPTM